MRSRAKAGRDKFPFLHDAVEAHIEHFPEDGSTGRPQKSLIKIIEELETNNFEPVFCEFNKQESIYGFGDLQVRRLVDEVTRNS